MQHVKTPPQPRVDKLPAERHALILGILRDRGAVTIATLAELLNASKSTVRRDLDDLNEHGYITRTHGGAVMHNVPAARFEPGEAIADETSRKQKLAIGALAPGQVKDGQCVILDSGSTARAAALALAQSGLKLTVVTNDLRIATEMVDIESIHAIVTGGTIRRNTSTLNGSPGLEFLASIHADVAFVGIHAIANGKCTETSLEVAAMKKAMLSAARRKVVLADSTKFSLPSFCEICSLGDVDEVITDDGIDPDVAKDVEAHGTDVSIASTQTTN